VLLVAGTYQVIALGVLRAQRRSAEYAALSAGSLAVYFILAVLLIVVWRADANALILAFALSQIVGATIGAIRIGAVRLPRPTRPTVVLLLVTGLPLAPAVAAVWIGEFLNRGILLSAAGAAEVGYLSVALRLASVVGLVVAGFQLAWLPHVYALGAAPDERARIAVEGRRIVALVALVVAGLSLIAPELLVVVSGDRYLPALRSVGWSALALLLVALTMIGSTPSALATKMRDLGIVGVAGVAAAVALNVLVAAKFGSAGTAAALAMGQGVAAGVAIWLGRRRLDVPWPWARMASISLAAAIVAIGSTLPDGGAPLAVRAALAVAFVLVLVAEGVVSEVIEFVRHSLAVDSRDGREPVASEPREMREAIERDAARVRQEYGRRGESASLQAYYRRIAEATNRARDERLRLTLTSMEAVGLPRYLRVLDVGCGSGDDLAFLVEAGYDSTRLAGVDLMEAAVLQARGALPSSDLRVANAAALPYETGAFDIVLQTTALSSVVDPSVRARIAAEMARVTRPGGLMVSYDMRSAPRNNPHLVGVDEDEALRLFAQWGTVVVMRRVTVPIAIASRLPRPVVRMLSRIQPLLGHLLVVVERAP
jgi:O-antigen/teichoic acid export membrane protein/SAM-dependent methyltransferase